MDFRQYVFEVSSPEVFGEKHIIGSLMILLMIGLFLFLCFVVFTKIKHHRVLQGIAVFLLILEVIKYVFTWTKTGEYPLNYLPFQLCSFSLYLMPIVAFGKGKMKEFLTPVAFTIGLLAGLIVLIYPATVLGGSYTWKPLSENIIPMISFVYHGVMILFSLYLMFSKVYTPKIKDYSKVYVSLLFFALLAGIVNTIFGTDMMFLNTASGSPLQFVLLEYGRVVYMLVMLLLAGVLLLIPFGLVSLKTIFINGRSTIYKKSKEIS